MDGVMNCKMTDIYKENLLDGKKYENFVCKVLKEKISIIEEMSGKSFNDVVRPGISKYAEVQKGVVNQTVNNHEQKISEEKMRVLKYAGKESARTLAIK
jgi:hypothetical protein